MFSFIRKWAQTRVRNQRWNGEKQLRAARRLGGFEPLEDRKLMAVDAFIWFENPGVGESPTAPPEHIEIESFSFGTSNSSTGGQAGGAGKATVLDFVRKSTDDHSSPYLTYRLENVFVSSFQIGGSDAVPIESLSINFGVIHIPRIGQELVVSFEEGDPDQPIVVGSVVGDFDGDSVPYVLTAAELGAGAANFPACATGEHIGYAELTIRSVGQPPTPLAQLAVNIVDYIDEDEIGYPFHALNSLPIGAGDPAGSQASPYFVFGTELPAIVLNEALAQFNLIASPEYLASNFAHPGGANVAAGDLNGDGVAEVVTGVATGMISGSGNNFVVELKNVLISSYQVGSDPAADPVLSDLLASQEYFQVVGAADDASSAVAPMFCVQYRETDFNFSIYLVTPGPDDNLPQPPVVLAGDDVTLVEGQTFNQSGIFEAGGGAWTVAVDYGDGTGEQPLMFNSDKSFSLNHTYTDDGSYTVTVEVTDDKGAVGSDMLTVTVTDALPHIGGAAIAPSVERQNATLEVTIDPTNPHDELTLTIDWGDGTAPQMFACPSDPSVLRFSHRYAHDGLFTVKLRLADDDGSVDTSSLQANVQNVDIIVVGADAGAGPHVKVFDSNTHKVKFDFMPYASKFHGGVRVATGDVNGDGIPDIITAPGMGLAGHVKAFDGATGQLTRSFLGFEKTFLGGVYVAAGDVNGDGRADIIVGRGSGKGEVRVFNGANGSLLSGFFAYGPGAAGFYGTGVYVAAGDVNGDGRADVITGSTGGMSGPLVKVFDGTNASLLRSFFAYSPNFHGGVFVAAGDLNGDGRDDIVTGAGPGSAAHVKVFDAVTLQAIDSFFAYPGFQGGVRVAVGDVNGDGIPDIITGAGKGPAQPLHAFDGQSLAALDSFFALDPRTSKGLFVAGSR